MNIYLKAEEIIYFFSECFQYCGGSNDLPSSLISVAGSYQRYELINRSGMMVTPIWISRSGTHIAYSTIEDGSSSVFSEGSKVGDIWVAVNVDGLVIPINGQCVYNVSNAHPEGLIEF